LETIGHSVKFIAMGIETKNFLINTGSFVICALLIIIIAFGKYLINELCACFPQYEISRKIGMFCYQDDYK
jgi:hypothetical protein